MSTQKKAPSKKSKTEKLIGNGGGGPNGPSGHWTQWIEPGGAALLSERLLRCYFIVKNHGPGTVRLWATNGDDFDVAAGAVRATYAYELIRVENRGENPVFIEFDFLPLHFK